MVVGIDIGTSAVKAVRLVLTRSGWLIDRVQVEPLDDGVVRQLAIAGPASVGRAVQLCARDASEPIALVVASQNDMAKAIRLPLMNDDELAEQIAWEAEQYIPYDIGDCEIGYHVVRREPGAAEMDVQLFATDKGDYAGYVDTARHHEIDVGSAMPALLAPAVWYVENHPAADAVVFDVGASCTTMAAIVDGVIALARRIDRGGDDFTVRLRDALAMSRDEAEALKRGADPDEQRAGPYRGQDRTALVRRELAQVADGLAAEMLRFIDFNEATNKAVDAVALVGGAAQTPGLVDAVARVTSVPVSLWDPTESLLLGEGVDGMAVRRHRYLLASALGAACRRMDGYRAAKEPPRKGLWARLFG